jgi:3-isopropylmalate/(R)-2-methylmalate dehydratase small subunit
MQPFRTHKGKVAPLDRDNIDTDQIIPKQFLKRIERTGFGEFLFYDWRRGQGGLPDPTFSLNNPRHAGASILVTGKNFGCGSSREHAVWALDNYGFRAVVAPSFADIFANNCAKNGVLTIVLDEEKVAEITQRARQLPEYHLTIDLEQREIHDDHGFSAMFQIDDFTRHCLLHGLDDIGLTLQHQSEIATYEASHPVARRVV